MTITKMVSLSLCRLTIKRAWQMKTLLGGRTWQPWWRVIQMKEPQIYLVDKAGEGSSLFMGGRCLILNTFTLRSLWKGVHWGKGAVFISGCTSNFKVDTLGGCSYFIWCFEPAWGQIQPPNKQAWFQGGDGGRPFWQASALCRTVVQGLRLLVPPQIAPIAHRGALVGDNKLQTKHQPYLCILLASHC